jgi:carboxypeptidase family protein/TonB-dependent receptor-like protein
MTRTLRYLLLFVFTGLSGSTFAQEIAGRILDDKKEPLPSAVVQVYKGGILQGGNVTDYDGNYSIKPLDPGYYTVVALYAGYDSIIINEVIVSPGQRTSQNFTMSRHIKGLPEVVVRQYKKPLVDQDKPGSHILTKDEIAEVPTNEITDLVSLAPGSYQQKRGQDLNLGGGRTTGTLYIIDGVQVQSTIGINMSQGGVDQLEVISSGIPANYGDVSGGVVNITSRGVSQKLTGDFRLQHSVDGYNNNLASFSIAGPLYKKKIPGDETHKKPVFGFALSGDVYDDHDRYPTYYEDYVAKGDVMNNLTKNPLKIVADNSGNPVYNYASDYVGASGLTQSKIPPRDVTQEARLNGKLDYQVTDNMHIVAGGSFDYTKADQYNRSQIMFAPGMIPVETTIAGRGYIRFTQKFGKSNDTSSKKSIISNAYYSVQADYQKLSQDREDPTFKRNPFEYSYVGQFNETRTNQYTPASAGGKDSLTGRNGTVLVGNQSTGITFDRTNTLNPTLANYTSQYFNSLNGNLPIQMTQIQANNAMANGDEPGITYGLNYSPGATQSFYAYNNSNQYALSVDASFDLLLGKTKHAIEFGLYYQQRIESSYLMRTNLSGYSTTSLWSQMRQLVSSIDNGNLKLDKLNPIFKVNGQSYTLADINNGKVLPGPNDTIIYNYTNIGSGLGNDKGTPFDQNLRAKLKLGPNDDINIDALSPSTFSLNMFTADELLNSGHPFVTYYGYNYLGGAQAGNVNFNDFWTQKDASGNYTRPIAAFSPNYIAGYLLDKFNYKDVHFNVGVRVDRYSANTKVLIDPYSELPEKTVSQVPGSENPFNNGAHPANIGGNYVVYVNDPTSNSPTIIGYRNGNNWYDPTGKFIEDPAILKNYSGGVDPKPYVVKNANGNIPSIKDTGFNPNSSFTDYTPQVTVQPRVSFNFPISDVADFYAHYDIYSQRPYPSSLGYATPYDYYALQENANTIINNANLKPEQTFDYEVGFQQKLSDHSALTITGFYKERKNQIAVVPYLYAYPTTYYTYGNRDFSTTKGTTLNYDLRATSHLRMTIAYTLQFAEGTGSTPNSGNGAGAGYNGQISPNGILQNFIEAGLPNLRYVTALDYDARHTITANIDYRFKDGEGPMIGNSHVFQNMGIDLIPKGRSGEPYTRYSDALGHTVIGGINGSRMPWHYGVDMRIDKDFALTHIRKHPDAPQGVKPKRPLYIKAIVQVNNLLNTKDITGVYGYTGKPDDDGYLSSSYGKQFVPQQIDPNSYTAQKIISVNNPGNYNYARTINLALEFNF